MKQAYFGPAGGPVLEKAIETLTRETGPAVILDAVDAFSGAAATRVSPGMRRVPVKSLREVTEMVAAAPATERMVVVYGLQAVWDHGVGAQENFRETIDRAVNKGVSVAVFVSERVREHDRKPVREIGIEGFLRSCNFFCESVGSARLQESPPNHG